MSFADVTQQVEAAAAAQKPPHTFELPVVVFSSDASPRPTGPVSLGMRRLSDGELSLAGQRAAQLADRAYPDRDESSDLWIDAYNTALMRRIISDATTRVDVVGAPYWADEDDVARDLLEGLVRVWDEYELMTIGTSCTTQEIDEEGLGRLVERLADLEWGDLTKSEQRLVRRLLGHALVVLDRAAEDVDDAIAAAQPAAASPPARPPPSAPRRRA